MRKGVLRAICLALLSQVSQQFVRANRYDVEARRTREDNIVEPI